MGNRLFLRPPTLDGDPDISVFRGLYLVSVALRGDAIANHGVVLARHHARTNDCEGDRLSPQRRSDPGGHSSASPLSNARGSASSSSTSFRARCLIAGLMMPITCHSMPALRRELPRPLSRSLSC